MNHTHLLTLSMICALTVSISANATQPTTSLPNKSSVKIYTSEEALANSLYMTTANYIAVIDNKVVFSKEPLIVQTGYVARNPIDLGIRMNVNKSIEKLPYYDFLFNKINI